MDLENSIEKMTPLMLALMKGNMEIVSNIEELKLGNRHYKNADDETILDIAMRLNVKRIIQFMTGQDGA